MVFHWSLNDSKSSQVSRTLLGILADLENAVIWVVSTRPLISKFSSPFTNRLVTVPSAPITIGITVTFMFHNFFFDSLTRSWYSFFFLFSFNFTLWSAITAESTILKVLFFFLLFLFFIYLFIYFVRFVFQGGFWLVRIPFVRMVKFKFLAQFPVHHLVHPVVSTLILFCDSLLYSLIM